MPELVNATPRIVVIGVGGAGGNAVNNMIDAGLDGVKFIVANTDMQALAGSRAEHRIQLGRNLTEGLGAGSRPEIGESAADEAFEEIRAQIGDAHMLFIAAGMGGGTGTGAAYVVARAAKEAGILTVAVVTKPFQFEGAQRMRNAEAGIAALVPYVDTLLVIPNENLFKVATDRTTFAEAFVVADQVLYSGIACLVDLIVEEGLINLDLADVRTILSGMGTAMMGMGEASGEQRAIVAAEEAIVNPLLDNVTLKGANSLLLSITGGRDLTLWEVDETANRIRQEVDPDANIIVGATLDEDLGDKIRVSIVASGMPSFAPVEPANEIEGPVWSPRVQPTSSVGPEPYGRRLAEAIGGRDAGKARKSPKGRGRSRNATASGVKLSDEQGGSPMQQPSARARKARRATTDPLQHPSPPAERAEVRQRRRQPSVVETAASVGWPEHWAKAGENASQQHAAQENAIEPPVARPAPSARGGDLFRRLASLVGAKREA
jgi:cell division protein FtsZ